MKRLPRILITDDDPAILKFVRANLKLEGYEIFTANDGVEALKVFEREMPDLVILDIVMPNVDGLEVCRQLRGWSKVPIIMLSARGYQEDKVKCLSLGADDYISKPFGIEELIARVKAVMRRTYHHDKNDRPALRCHDLVIDFARHRVTRDGYEIDLTGTEFRLVSYLANNTDRILTTDQILRAVWGEEYRGESHLLHVNIGRLRQKLEEDARNPRYILTRPGIGYMMPRCEELNETPPPMAA
jgi:DNA-binding response OmpR family regulator